MASSMSWMFAPRFLLLVLVLVGTAVGATTGTQKRLEKRWASSYDLPFSYQCPQGEALSYMHSVHDNHREDRIWDFHCQPFPGAGDCRLSPPANNWDGNMNFQCPRNEVIAGMAGVHSNKHEDRIYFFVCCKAKVQLTRCSWTGDLNNFDTPMTYDLPSGRVFHGVHSRHSNHHEDRIWRVEVCVTV